VRALALIGLAVAVTLLSHPAGVLLGLGLAGWLHHTRRRA